MQSLHPGAAGERVDIDLVIAFLIVRAWKRGTADDVGAVIILIIGGAGGRFLDVRRLRHEGAIRIVLEKETAAHERDIFAGIFHRKLRPLVGRKLAQMVEGDVRKIEHRRVVRIGKPGPGTP